MSLPVTIAIWVSSAIAILLLYWYGAVRTYYWLASSRWAGLQKNDGTVRLHSDNWAWAVILWPVFVPLKSIIVGLFVAARKHALKPPVAKVQPKEEPGDE